MVLLGDQFTGIEVANGFLCSGDGNLDIGLIFASVPLASALGGSGLLGQFFSPITEPLSLPLGQTADVPSNICAPVQCELFGTYQKNTYHLGVPPGKRSVYGLSLRGPLSAFLDLANSPELGFDAFIALIGQVTFREFDVLRDEAEAYGRKLDAAGVEVTVTRYNGMIHDFGLLNVLAGIPGTRSALLQASQELKAHLK